MESIEKLPIPKFTRRQSLILHKMKVGLLLTHEDYEELIEDSIDYLGIKNITTDKVLEYLRLKYEVVFNRTKIEEYIEDAGIQF